jgi:hypothetical protein
MSLSRLVVPEAYNYIACFLTLDCNLNCNYCINSFGRKKNFSAGNISGEKWGKALNRLIPRPDLPVTLQGGEPSLHSDFIWIINQLRPDLPIDILTNLCFDVDNFIANVNSNRLRRKAPYASIRASYHPPYMNLEKLIDSALKLKKAGFFVGVYGLGHPEFKEQNFTARKKCLSSGIDFRIKDFLGEFKGKMYGKFRYPESVGSKIKKNCLCRIPELIIGPDCSVYKCHHDLYGGCLPIGNLLDNSFKIENKFRKCFSFGDCNPCDVKIKTNRFEAYGYCSAEIKDIKANKGNKAVER